MTSSYRVEDLIEGKVDAFNAYISNEPFYLEARGVEPYSLNPLNYGVDLYSDLLFTSQTEIERHPDRVNAFLSASLKGWEYALQHPHEVVEHLLTLPGITKSREALLEEARILGRLIQPQTVPIGNINPGRFERMSAHLQRFGFIDQPRPLNDFVYDPNPKIQQATFLKAMALAVATALAILLMALWFWRTNQRLKHEITLRQQTQRSLEASQQHFQRIVENLQEVYYRTDLDGTLLYASPSASKMLKLPMQYILGRNIERFYAPPHKRADFLDALRSQQGSLKNYELQILDGLGNKIWVSTNSRYYYENGEAAGVEGTLQEITQQKQHREQMRSMAFEDPLTGLFNRRKLLESLNKALKTRHLQGGYGALLFMDLDNFKPVNDTHGHHVGDLLLQTVAERLRQSVRQHDLLFRLGGDEFVILLTNLAANDIDAAQNQALQIADHLLQHLRTPYQIDGLTLSLSASIGIKRFPDDRNGQPDTLDADALIQLADQGLYRAKKHGKNQAFLV